MNDDLTEGGKIAAFAVGAAVAYGVLHDQITAHLCVEYFTKAHPPVFPTESPFLLALGWGVIATWWVGLALGLGLAAAARLGRSPKLGLAELWRPILLLMLVTAAGALLAGIVGASLARTTIAMEIGSFEVPQDKLVAFTAVAAAHEASYGVGALAGVFVMCRTIWLRGRLRERARVR